MRSAHDTQVRKVTMNYVLLYNGEMKNKHNQVHLKSLGPALRAPGLEKMMKRSQFPQPRESLVL